MPRSTLQDCRSILIPMIPVVGIDLDVDRPFGFYLGQPMNAGAIGWFTWRDRTMLRCECGLTMAIGDRHQIADDGTVTPSLHHKANDEADCGLHVFGRLVGWEKREEPQ